MKVEILWITMVVIFFQRDGLTLYLCFEQTTQGFMIDSNRGKAIPIKCFVSHHPPSREGGSVGWAKKRNEHMKGSECQ